MTDFSNNPLYHPPETPDFARIQPEHVAAIAQIITENRAEIELLIAQKEPTWDNLMQPLERLDNRLAKAFSPVGHLFGVMSTDAWRNAYETVLPLLSEYGSDLGQNEKLYAAVKAVKDRADFAQLSAAQQKTVNNALENFERSGVALSADAKAEFKKNSLRLSTLSTQFSKNVLDATNAWELCLESDELLRGVPDSARALMADLAEKSGSCGYRLTLDAPVVMPILTYADDRALRKDVYTAYNVRASELSDEAKFDNAAVIEEILTLRRRQAELLGFPDFAAYSVANKMAKTSQAVFDFLDNLVQKTKPAGEKEMQTLRQFAAEACGINDMQPWDVAYISEKLRQKKYALSQEDLRPYFPLSKVISGMFAIVGKLFGVQFRENKTLSTWHKDVRAYDLLTADGALQAQFYLDPFAREKKRGGAWMDGAVTRFLDNGTQQLPVAYLVCNFTPPIGAQDAYLTHNEVTTLFHEFGHGLHHMLTQIDVYSVAGINGVEWDAVEQPSQFMENFCYDFQCLQMMTAHQKTGAPLPDDLFQKLIAAKNFQSAMAMLRQLEFALFDFYLHTADARGKNVLAVLKAVRAQVAVTPDFADNRFPMAFSHIFAGGYAAGYYSYKWAEVLSADSFAAFSETGLFNPETGNRFRDEILAVGGSRTSMESFIAFRGRAPKIDALLKQSGI